MARQRPRRLTFDERCRLILAAARVRDEVDRTLGELLLAAADGDATALVAAADRAAEVGLEDAARRLLQMLR